MVAPVFGPIRENERSVTESKTHRPGTLGFGVLYGEYSCEQFGNHALPLPVRLPIVGDRPKDSRLGSPAAIMMDFQ